MYSITFYLPADKQLRTLTTPTPMAALAACFALRSLGYRARIWSHRTKKCPRMEM